MFWQWPARARETASEQPWARAVALEFAVGQGLATHSAPADALLICTGGSVRFVLEGEERQLRPGDGVSTGAGQPHAVIGGAPGQAVLVLRRVSDPA